MEFQVLKKDNLKRNIIIGVFAVLIISAVVLNFTRAKYRSTASVPIVDSEVNYVRPDLEIIALYINGVQAEELDSNTNYTLDTTNSTCTYKDGSSIDNLTLSYDSDTKTFTITPYTTRGTKCTLYFEEAKPLLADIIKGYNQSTRSDFSTVYTTSTTNTVFTANDGDGTTYYFAGAPTDNWVYFAGFYWRIIRVNGDGSIRLIYQGTSATATGRNTQIGFSAFNSSSDNNMYVGFMYTQNQVHGLGSNSTVKGVLDGWYHDNLLTNYDSYIEKDTGFCGDRSPYIYIDSSNDDLPFTSGGGIGTTRTFYGAYLRLNYTLTPTFDCTNDSDLYTVSDSSKGNNALTYPIGLITADEVAFAGGVWTTINTSYYLYTGHYYWTMSPSDFVDVAFIFNVNNAGSLYDWNVDDSYGIRPVINIRSDVTISSGNGTASTPFVIE